MNVKVDEFLNNAKAWQKELAQLRRIVLDCGLTEELKWGVPCYTHRNGNIALLGGFKEYCVLSFFKGVLLHDAEGILVAPGENSQAVRMVKFTSVQAIVKLEPVLKTYIHEAMKVEEDGLKVDFKESTNLEFPEELLHKLNADPAFKAAFEALTPGRQRAYNLYFTAAKQPETRVARIEKYVPRILNGKGINDCVCGRSKRMPNCDGSHKVVERDLLKVD